MKKNKILTVLFCMLILFFFAACDVLSSGGTGGSGSDVVYTDSNYSTYGSAANPFAISTPSHLKQIQAISSKSGRNFSGKIIKLMSDIDMSGVTDFYGIGYAPSTSMGTNTFNGTFDGNSKKISNLVINNNNRTVGLILHAGKGAVIKNLGIESGSITNSYAKDSVAYAGGIVAMGMDNDVTISNCYNNASVTTTAAKAEIGGIVGSIFLLERSNNIIENCYNTGVIFGNGTKLSAGGISGVMDGKISNCYNTGEVKNDASDGYVGGITGFAGLLTIEESYNIAKINKRSNVSGGNISGAFSVLAEDCYYLDLVNNNFFNDSDATKLTVSEFGDLAKFTNFYSSVWQIKSVPAVNGVTSRPVLKGVGEGI